MNSVLKKLAGGLSLKTANDSVVSQTQTSHMVAYVLIDVSGSMDAENRLEEAKQGALHFAEKSIAKGYHIGLVTFGSRAEYVADPTDNLSFLTEKISPLCADGGTDMTGALIMASECFEDISPDYAAVVLITDGLPNDRHAVFEESQKLIDSGVVMITIGTGSGADYDFLAKIASAEELATVVASEDLGDTIASASEYLSLPEK